jgi:hypothetical protein
VVKSFLCSYYPLIAFDQVMQEGFIATEKCRAILEELNFVVFLHRRMAHAFATYLKLLQAFQTNNLISEIPLNIVWYNILEYLLY